jgi:flagella basal body P-ring formation protein FlgA
MASSRADTKTILVAVVALAATLRVSSFVMADTLPKAPAADDRTDVSGVSDLAAQVQSQLPAMVPMGIRVDHVQLGCKPPPGSELKAVAPGIAQLTSRSFIVELQKGDRSIYCSATLDASRQVLTANRDIQPESPVTSADFQPQWIDAFGGSAGALADFPDHGPYASATMIRAGQPLYQNSLLRPIAVHPGDMVMVVVKNGPVSVRAQLQAQSQAAIGDSLSAINPVSGIPVTVTVTGPRNAELVMQ